MLGILSNFLEKREFAEFNSVIEGTYHDEWFLFHYKLANLSIPKNVSLINDGTNKYSFFGKTEDFISVDQNKKTDSLEIEVDSLSFGPGIVLPFRGGIPNILDRPRTISLRDGRIFVDEHMIIDEKYVKAIPEILQTANKLFTDKQTNENYKKIMAQYNFGKNQCGGFAVYSS